jgi:hypothetical protein
LYEQDKAELLEDQKAVANKIKNKNKANITTENK